MGCLDIVAEERIPFLRGVLDDVARVRLLPAESVTAETVRGADALLTRTRTRVDERLLGASRCRFVATATIGTDHIDLPWCASAGVTVANAPGCNAPAVAQYVLRAVIERYGISSLPRLTIGVVGVGNVGRIVARWAAGLGMTVLLCDPPRAAAEGPGAFTSLDEVARRCDVVTFHTPLTAGGCYPTMHLADRPFFAACRRRPLVINAARGPVVHTQALVEALAAGTVGAAAIDCWEGEPAIDARLLAHAFVATPHIAGYSRQGKIRATEMALKALCDHFGLPVHHADAPLPAPPPQTVGAAEIEATYDIMADTRALRESPEAFERLRNTYSLRDEPGQ